MQLKYQKKKENGTEKKNWKNSQEFFKINNR